MKGDICANPDQDQNAYAEAERGREREREGGREGERERERKVAARRHREGARDASSLFLSYPPFSPSLLYFLRFSPR